MSRTSAGLLTWTLLFDRNGSGLGASLVCWHCCSVVLAVEQVIFTVDVAAAAAAA